eukprot:755109-Hanusia_phi.AAC.3
MKEIKENQSEERTKLTQRYDKLIKMWGGQQELDDCLPVVKDLEMKDVEKEQVPDPKHANDSGQSDDIENRTSDSDLAKKLEMAVEEIENLTRKNEMLLAEFNQAMQSSYYIVQGCISLSKELEGKSPEVFAMCFSQDAANPWTGD